MTRLQRWIGCAVVALGAVGLCHPAAAQSPVALLVGSTITVDGLQMTVGSCKLTLLGVSQSDCSTGHLQISALTGPGAGIEISGDGTGSNGANIFSLAQNACAGFPAACDDVNFTLNIVGVDPKTTVSSAAMTLAAVVGSSNDLLNASGGENILNSSGTVVAHVAANPSSTGNPVIANGSTSFSPMSSFSVNKDLALHSSTGEALTLSYVTQLYTPAPEPVSIGIFLVGLAGLGAARRRAAASAGCG